MSEITLKYPVTDTDGEIYEKLTLRRPTVKDLKVMDRTSGDVEKIAALIARITSSAAGSKLTDYVVDRIDAEDFAAIGDIVDSFLSKSPTTGER